MPTLIDPLIAHHWFINEGDHLCHLKRDGGPDKPICGAKNPVRCPGPGDPVPPGPRCAACGRKTCPTCRSISDNDNNTGGYEGAD